MQVVQGTGDVQRHGAAAGPPPKEPCPRLGGLLQAALKVTTLHQLLQAIE